METLKTIRIALTTSIPFSKHLLFPEITFVSYEEYPKSVIVTQP